jgi:hypothetical protein
VDDISVFGNDKRFLWMIKEKVSDFLKEDRLKLHPGKTFVAPVSIGIDHLGYRVYPTHRRLRKDNSLAFRKKLKDLAKLYNVGKISFDDVNASVQSWLGHAKHADTYGLRKNIFSQTGFSRE